MIKFRISFWLILIAAIIIIFTSTYTHYKTPVNDDEWRVAIIAKEIVNNGHISISEEIKIYPKGLHNFIGIISITSEI